MGMRRRSTVCDVLQRLDPAEPQTWLAGVLFRHLVRLGFARFAAFLLLALGQGVFRSGGRDAQAGAEVDLQSRISKTIRLLD